MGTIIVTTMPRIFAHFNRAYRDKVVLVGILSLALGLRLAFVKDLSTEAVFATVDAQGYYLLAMNWLEGGSPSLLSGVRTPLYPLFLAGVLWVVKGASPALPWIQSLLDTATVALIYGLTVRLATLRRGQLAALFYALNPISFLYIGLALTEILLAFLLALTFYIFVIATEARNKRYSLLAMAGFVSGLGILCKPNVLGLPLILAFSLFFGRQRGLWRALRESSVVVGVALLTLLPWLIRNRVVFGEWFLSLAFDSTLARVSAVATILEVEGETVAPWTPRWEEVYLNQIAAVAEDRYGWLATEQALSDAVQHRHEMAAVARGIISAHPEAFLTSHLKGVLRSFVPHFHRQWYAYLADEPWPENESLQGILAQAGRQAGRGDWSAALDLIGDWWGRLPALAQRLWLASVVLHVLAYGLLIAGMWVLRTRPVILLGLGLALLYLVFLPGPIAYVRFWMPGVPLAVVVMACAFYKQGMSTLSSKKECFA
jgi:4-amino-4-deoxy-L-arabinose transferase-like glycosyltransferase